MNGKKLCCLVTVTAILVSSLLVTPFAIADQPSQLSAEELAFVFRPQDTSGKGRPEFLVYLDEKEIKETEGRLLPLAVPIVSGIGSAAFSIALDLQAGRDISTTNAAIAGVAGFTGAGAGAVVSSLGASGLASAVVGGIGSIIGGLGTSAGLNLVSGGGGGCIGCHANVASSETLQHVSIRISSPIHVATPNFSLSAVR